MKIAFLDRDGTIIHDYEDNQWKYITKPEFIDNSINALKEICSKGYEIIIITNQYIINDGIITSLQYNEFTNKFVEELNFNKIHILDIFYCPHSKHENCNCMKPKTGLIEMALRKYPDIELNNSFIAGDSLCDVELGHKLGIKTFGINIETNSDYLRVKSLWDVVQYI